MNASITTTHVAGQIEKSSVFSMGCRFWWVNRKRLSHAEFNHLMETGFVEYRFGVGGSGKRLLLTFRAIQQGQKVLVNLDAIRIRRQEVVGHLDFSVFLDSGIANVETLVALPSPFFTNATEIQMRDEYHFPPDFILQINRLRKQGAPEGEERAFWIRKGYRGRDGADYSGLSHILMSTAVRIAKGLQVKEIHIGRAAGATPSAGAEELMRYHQREFAAVPKVETTTSMVIWI